jgi:hypothetical protein
MLCAYWFPYVELLQERRGMEHTAPQHFVHQGQEAGMTPISGSFCPQLLGSGQGTFRTTSHGESRRQHQNNSPIIPKEVETVPSEHLAHHLKGANPRLGG